MTPEALTALALCVMEFRDWLRDQEGDSLDMAVLSGRSTSSGLQRQRLTMDGAR